MPLKNTYTKVPVERTVSEISRILANKGATQVVTDYGEGAHAVGLRFRVNSRHGPLFYELPVNADAVHGILIREARLHMEATRLLDQSRRVAWRNIKDWTDAQMALIETGMAEMEQVFLPYMLGPGDQTLYRKLADGGFRALPAGVVDVPGDMGGQPIKALPAGADIPKGGAR